MDFNAMLIPEVRCKVCGSNQVKIITFNCNELKIRCCNCDRMLKLGAYNKKEQISYLLTKRRLEGRDDER